MKFNTLQEVDQYAATHGIVLSATERAKIGALQQAERQRLEALDTRDNTNSWAERWNAFYPALLESVIRAGETILTFSQTVIVSLGVPTVLVLLLIVEHQRVVHGIQLFEQDPSLAGFAAAALVLLNLVLEFQVHYIEHKAGYSEAQARRWSLRIWAKNMAYRLGISNQDWGLTWQEQLLSPAARYRSLLRLVTFSILALALVGSMRAVIQAQPGKWYEALFSILSESSLLLMMTWAGGVLFAAAAVLSAQGLSRYVAIRCVEIIAAMDHRQSAQGDPFAAQVEQAGAIAAYAVIQAKLADKEAKRERANPTLQPIQVVTAHEFHQNGNGNGQH